MIKLDDMSAKAQEKTLELQKLDFVDFYKLTDSLAKALKCINSITKKVSLQYWEITTKFQQCLFQKLKNADSYRSSIGKCNQKIINQRRIKMKHICPICKKYYFNDGFDVCPVCDWTFDIVQEKYPESRFKIHPTTCVQSGH